MPGLAVANACLIVGVLVLAALWFGPLLPMSRTSFSAHMLLHLGLVVVASPLIAWGLAARLPPPSSISDALSWCLLAMAFEMVAVWGWHVPLLHDAQGRNGGLFVLEQASFLAAGVGLWTAAFCSRTRQTAAAAGVALFLTFTHMTMFGLVLTLAPRLIYDPSLCQGGFGLDRLDDQHLGGILMAIGGGLPYLLGSGWAAYRLLR
jgi:putative membrane protein